MMTTYPPEYDWIPFYKEMADKLLQYKDDRKPLVSLINEIFETAKLTNPGINNPFIEKMAGNVFTDTCPFTIFASINRKITVDNRRLILSGFKDKLGITADIPNNFDGIPLFSPQHIWFYEESRVRKPECIPNLWKTFECAVNYGKSPTDANQIAFVNIYDIVTKQPMVKWSLSIGLYWICPERYLSLDDRTREYLSENNVLPGKLKKLPTGNEYLSVCSNVMSYLEKVPNIGKTFYEFSKNIYNNDFEDKTNINDNMIEEKSTNHNHVTHPNNIILYGPPGTGKTYNTVNYAVSIIEGKKLEEMRKKDYKDVFKSYCGYKDDKLIEFVTFHQSYSYEDFVEGIKPRVDTETRNVTYDVEDGVFKKFCKLSSTSKDAENLIGDNPKIWKVSLGQRGKESNIKEDCFKNSYIRIGFDDAGEEPDFETITEGKIVLSAFINKMQIGDLVLILSDWKSIDAIGVITGDYQWLENQKEYKRCRKVKWFFTDKKVSIYELNGNTTLSLSTVYELTNISQESVLTLIKENSDEFAEKPTKPHVFIIDEINRGNISKIFGELITLIEPSKRLGADEEISVTLPYSKQSFGVPNNVYILGTMNTADRSLTRIDTALRRRFTFREMLPDVDVLDGIEIEGVNISKLLKTMNERIEFLLDRDHTIGHAYFVGLRDNSTLEKLAEIFRDRIIPLLQEYFYEDYQKIQMVLGDSDDDTDTNFVIKEVREDTLFKNRDISGDVPDARYKINEKAFDKFESYKKIYE